MLASDLINIPVRRQVADTKPGYRYVPPTMLAYCNEGLRELWSTHPEFFYVSTILTSYPGDLDSLAKELPINIHGTKALTDYICVRIFEETGEDADNAAKMQMHQDDYDRAVST